MCGINVVGGGGGGGGSAVRLKFSEILLVSASLPWHSLENARTTHIFKLSDQAPGSHRTV